MPVSSTKVSKTLISIWLVESPKHVKFKSELSTSNDAFMVTESPISI